jgi:hypothetical protein
MIDGQAFRQVEIPATGDWQLLRLESVKCYILVHPNGRQAWFHDSDLKEITSHNPGFRYTSQPLRDLKRLAHLGLRPFHVDADFDVDGFKRLH